jgi:hypothetical protein
MDRLQVSLPINLPVTHIVHSLGDDKLDIDLAMKPSPTPIRLQIVVGCKRRAVAEDIAAYDDDRELLVLKKPFIAGESEIECLPTRTIWSIWA